MHHSSDPFGRNEIPKEVGPDLLSHVFRMHKVPNRKGKSSHQTFGQKITCEAQPQTGPRPLQSGDQRIHVIPEIYTWQIPDLKNPKFQRVHVKNPHELTSPNLYPMHLRTSLLHQEGISLLLALPATSQILWIWKLEPWSYGRVSEKWTKDGNIIRQSVTMCPLENPQMYGVYNAPILYICRSTSQDPWNDPNGVGPSEYTDKMRWEKVLHFTYESDVK